MINPETSDPNDPETNMWWIWIPLFFALFVLFMTFVFARDAWYESGTAAVGLSRLA